MMERLIAVSQDAVFKLESEPVSTVDFVNLLKSVSDQCHSYTTNEYLIKPQVFGVVILTL